MRHILTTNTDLLPILCPDLYETAISPSVVFGGEQEQLCEELPDDINPYDMGIDFDKYLLKLVEYANDTIESNVLPRLKPYGVQGIIATDFYHPAWYQFGSGRCDAISLKIVVDDTFFAMMGEEVARMSKDAAAQLYAKDHWTDKPGFLSWMPNKVGEIMTGWQHYDEVRQQSAYLTLLCRENGCLWRDDQTQEDSEAQAAWETKIQENLCFGDFISEADWELINANREVPEDTPEEPPKADEHPAVDAEGRMLYYFIAQGSKSLDGKMMFSGYFAEDAMASFAMGLVTGLRNGCKKAEIRVFTPDGKGGHTLVRVQR